MASGLEAAKTLLLSFENKDFSTSTLKKYDQNIKNSLVKKELYPYRNFRQSFHKGLWRGLISSVILTLTRGRWPRDIQGKIPQDAQVKRTLKEASSQHQGLSKADAVYLSGNRTRDKVASHLVVKDKLPDSVKEFYSHMCPAGVYEKGKDGWKVQAPNCIDCKATDILGPRWTIRERESGPNYKLM